MVLSEAADQQAFGTFCSFPLNKSQRFVSLCRGAEELILYFLRLLFAGQLFPAESFVPSHLLGCVVSARLSALSSADLYCTTLNR